VARRRRRRRDGDMAMLRGLGALGGIVLLAVVVRQIRAHPTASALIVLAVLAVVGLAVYGWHAQRRQLAEHERSVSATNAMTGTQFEHFTARLMRASGFRRVQVVGGSGDMGADVIAWTADGRRVVVQCKRLAGNLGSPHVQQFAGTARDIHRADVALLVTTGRPTTQAREIALRCQITLVDRPALARWVNTQAFRC